MSEENIIDKLANQNVDGSPLDTDTILAREHERGFEAGYSAAIHDARVEGSRAYEALKKAHNHARQERRVRQGR